MATPAELVRTIARVTGVPETTVINHDRNLAKAGLRTVGGRGTGAARMTAKDACNLLLAVVGAPAVKDSLIPIRVHSTLRQSYLAPQPKWMLEFAPIAELIRLDEGHTFGEALEALLTSATDGNLAEVFRRVPNDPETGRPIPRSYIEVTIMEPYKLATIEVSFGEINRLRQEEKEHKEIKYYWTPSREYDYFDPSHGDLLNLHKFTQETLIAIGQCLRSS